MLRAAAGEVFGPFTLLRPLSEQGVRQRWVVCRTDDTAREPFLLEILPGPLAEHRALQRPVREELAQLRGFRHGRFTHPGRMALTQNHIGFSFELPGTRTLEELLAFLGRERTPMPASAAVELVIKVAEALTIFHTRDVRGRTTRAHLSLRPSHIFLAPGGEIALSAAWVASLEHLWPWGPPESALPYIAPERVLGLEGGVPADLYALGRILRACLSLRPCKGDGRDLLLGYLQKQPEAPRLQSLVDVPLLQMIITDLLKADPAERPQSAGAVIESLCSAQIPLGTDPSLSEFLISIGWRDLARAPDLPIPTDGLQTEEFPAASQLGLSHVGGVSRAKAAEVEPEFDEVGVEEEIIFEGPSVDAEDDPFASLEAALSDLEVTFSDFDFPEDDDPPPRPTRSPRRSVRMGALRNKDMSAADLLSDDVEPSLTSVVVDISELLPDEAVKPLEQNKDRKPLAYLVRADRGGQTSRYSLDGAPVTVGRSPSNTVHITGDGRVSRLHCRITLEDGEFVLEDAGSNNGTLVDGVFVKRQALRGGEEIIIGGTVLQFSLSEGYDADIPPF